MFSEKILPKLVSLAYHQVGKFIVLSHSQVYSHSHPDEVVVELKYNIFSLVFYYYD